MQFSVWFGSDSEACVLKTMQYCKVHRLNWRLKSFLRFKCGSGEHSGSKVQAYRQYASKLAVSAGQEETGLNWSVNLEPGSAAGLGKALKRG